MKWQEAKAFSWAWPSESSVVVERPAGLEDLLWNHSLKLLMELEVNGEMQLWVWGSWQNAVSDCKSLKGCQPDGQLTSHTRRWAGFLWPPASPTVAYHYPSGIKHWGGWKGRRSRGILMGGAMLRLFSWAVIISIFYLFLNSSKIWFQNKIK